MHRDISQDFIYFQLRRTVSRRTRLLHHCQYRSAVDHSHWLFDMDKQTDSRRPRIITRQIQEIDKRLSESQPDVILVGSSLVNRAIDNKLFAKELGIPEQKVQKLWSGMATMPAVNLMIENRVLHQNLQPKVIAILCPPKWLAHSEVLQDAHFAMHQTRPLNPIIAEVLGLEQTGDSRPWKQRKTNFQDGYQEWNQELFGELVLGEGQADIDSKLDSLFAFENQRQNVKGSQLIQHNTRETQARTG